MKYRKKPIIVDVTQWFKEGDDPRVIENPIGSPMEIGTYQIGTLEGMMNVHPGDYIVTGIEGEAYCVNRKIFEATYEKVE